MFYPIKLKQGVYIKYRKVMTMSTPYDAQISSLKKEIKTLKANRKKILTAIENINSQLEELEQVKKQDTKSIDGVSLWKGARYTSAKTSMEAFQKEEKLHIKAIEENSKVLGRVAHSLHKKIVAKQLELHSAQKAKDDYLEHYFD